MPITATGSFFSQSLSSLNQFSLSPQAAGNCFVLILEVPFGSGPQQHVTAVTGGGVTTWTRIAGPTTDTGSPTADHEIWTGVITTGGGSHQVTLTLSGTLSAGGVIADCQEFTTGIPVQWIADPGTSGFLNNTSSTTVTYPTLTPAAAGELYVGNARCPSSSSYSGVTAGFTSVTDVNANPYIYGPVSAATGPTEAQNSAGTSNAISALVTTRALVPPQPPAVVAPRSARKITRAVMGGTYALSAGITPLSTVLAGPVITVTVTAAPGGITGAVTIVQQVSGTSTLDYGWSTVSMTTTAGNTLIVLAGWDLSTSATSAAMPAVYVTDSAGNRWEHVATSTSGVSGARAAAWVCVNAMAVTWISVSLTSFASSLAYAILEIANMPQYFLLDAVAANGADGGVSIEANPGAAGGPDIALSVLAAGAAGLAAIQGAASATVYSFESGTMGFTGVNASVTQSLAWSSDGALSLQVTAAGGAGLWYAPGPQVAVVASTSAYGTARIYAPAALGAVQVNLDWFDSSHVYISTSAGAQTPIAAGQVLTVNVTASAAPANAAFARITVADAETSAAGTVFYADQVTLNITSPPMVGWTALATVTAGATSASPVEIYPYWVPVTAGTSLATAYTLPQAVPMAVITFGISAAAAAPVVPNPNFPALKVEAAFGAQPGSPSQAPPDWTDITARAVAPDGGTYISAVMGREYELTTAEAGQLDISADNHDGAFTPGNTASPYTGVDVLTPVRVAALWAGRWYAVAAGYVQAWPQEWPDQPQWGITKIKAADAVAVLASLTMPSALDGDILLDGPYLMIPCSEQYTKFIGGLNPRLIPADAQGLLAANISRVNQRAAFYVDGTAASADTGQAAGLLGDQDSGFGTSSITTAPTMPVSGPGVIYTDPGLPDPLTPNGVTVEFWVQITATVATANLQPVVFSAYGPASNYHTARPSLQVLINNQTGSSTLSVILADGAVVTATFSVAAGPQLISITVSPSALAVYVNGALSATATLTAAQTTTWRAVSLGCPNYAYASGAITAGNFTAFDWAVYPYILAPQRIGSHYVTGFSGQSNVDATARIAQILSWGAAGIPRGGQVSFSGARDGVTQGPAYSLGNASAASAISAVAANHSAMAVVSPTGSLVYWHKWALFNQAPVAVFGDSPLPGSTEVPYLQASSYDYDTTYTYNADQVTQTDGPNTTITVTAYDFGSQASYFARSALTQSISTTSDLDVYDHANWNIAKYAHPLLRVKGVTVSAASNPAEAFPVVLALQQGQVAVVTRRPVGGAVISAAFIIQKITHAIGPGVWDTSLQLSPYTLESAVLTLGTPGYDTTGGSALA